MDSKKTNYKKIAQDLWLLLDKIDTASDVFKPSAEHGIDSYKAFYVYAMKISEKRHKLLKSDGNKIYSAIEFKKLQEEKKLESQLEGRTMRRKPSLMKFNR